jgi:hypothetical protein
LKLKSSEGVAMPSKKLTCNCTQCVSTDKTVPREKKTVERHIKKHGLHQVLSTTIHSTENGTNPLYGVLYPSTAYYTLLLGRGIFWRYFLKPSAVFVDHLGYKSVLYAIRRV